MLGKFVPEGLGKLPLGIKSPFSEEEMAEQRKAPKVGRQLVDIMRDLEKRGMKYVVHWDARAEADLAAVWIAAADRAAVVRAATWFDNHLEYSPLQLGESRTSSVHRLAYYSPLGIEFEVIEDDKRVVVQAVFATV